MSSAELRIGDVRAELAKIPDRSVDFVMSSPPFLGVRDYLEPGDPAKVHEIGSEPSPAAFVDVLLMVAAELRRVLVPTGTMVIELGDTFAGSGGAGGDYNEAGLRDGQQKATGSARQFRDDGSPLPGDKSLCLIPELFRVALVYGVHPLTGTTSPAGQWLARNVVRWVRTNPPVGALGDKFRPGTSDLVIAATAGDRWFDGFAVRVPASANTNPRVAKGAAGRNDLQSQQRTGNWSTLEANNVGIGGTAPLLDWWKINAAGYAGAHHAVYPPELCIAPIESMCPRRVCRTCSAPSRRLLEAGDPDPVSIGWTTCGCAGTDGLRDDGYHDGPGWRPGLVLDPFAGSGTTLAVATGHCRDALGIDLDHRNAELVLERVGPMFLTVTGGRP